MPSLKFRVTGPFLVQILCALVALRIKLRIEQSLVTRTEQLQRSSLVNLGKFATSSEPGYRPGEPTVKYKM